jgi:hypothetical protein
MRGHCLVFWVLDFEFIEEAERAFMSYYRILWHKWDCKEGHILLCICNVDIDWTWAGLVCAIIR